MKKCLPQINLKKKPKGEKKDQIYDVLILLPFIEQLTLPFTFLKRWECLRAFPNLSVLKLEKPFTINNNAMKIIGTCKTLKNLSITHSNITNEGVYHLTSLTKIVNLDLTGSALITDWSFLRYFTTLKCLKINQTKIDDTQKAIYIPSLRNLETLGLADTALKDTSFFAYLPNLTSLYLQGNRLLEGKELMVISSLPRLLSLSLQACDRLDHLMFIDPISLPLLSHLNISNCRSLKEKDIIRLEIMKNLQVLRITGCVFQKEITNLGQRLQWTVIKY